MIGSARRLHYTPLGSISILSPHTYIPDLLETIDGVVRLDGDEAVRHEGERAMLDGSPTCMPLTDQKVTTASSLYDPNDNNTRFPTLRFNRLQHKVPEYV